jgi:ABC-type polysaccharide/polyol phosphate transport system ATPase subunit
VDPAIIEFRGVSKSYPIYRSPADRLRELATFTLSSHHRDFRALDNVSFEIARGETFCIVGENGSGKSTTLQLMAAILHPTAGEVVVRGRVAALLELGAGFNHEFSGRDNVYLNAAIMGFSQREIDRKFPNIEAFAEIGEFIDQPVKTYSSGMVVRLAFAVAIHLDPEILLVDEALAVGDIYFRQRCMRKVHEMRARGVTIVFVSHSTADVKAIGDRTMWLDRGRLREIGNTEHVVSKYLASIVQKDAVFLKHSRAGAAEISAAKIPSVAESHQVVRGIPNIDHRYGDAHAELLGIAVLDSAGLPIAMLEPGSAIVVRISVMAHQRLELPIVGFMLRNHMGVDFAGTNTAREGFDLPPMNPGDVYTVDFHVQLPQLYPSQFSFSPAVADGTLASYVMCDWIDNAIALQMSRADQPVYGYVHLPCRVELTHG